MIHAALESDLEVERAKSIVEDMLRSNQRTATIFIDTMEFYGVRESQAASDCIRGLLNCCARIHHESPHIECRLFFPDELTHYVKSEISSSVLKDFRDVEFLRWGAPELTCLAALRLRDRVNFKNLQQLGLDGVTEDNVEEAQRVFHRYFPVTV